MEKVNYKIRDEAIKVLKHFYGEDASFRSGQYEAIEAVVLGKRCIVVEKTGWGKSLVYFVATKMLRDKGYGTSVVVSPLLALMNNQCDAARSFGFSAEILNYNSEKDKIIEKWKNDKLDIVFVTPETLFNEKIQKNILLLKMQL